MSGELFVSYSHRDSGFVQQLRVYLDQEEILPWTDNQLDVGDSWQEMIVNRIHRCNAFLLVMTPSSRQSTFVSKEIAIAREDGKRILPVLIEGEVFEELNDLQFVDLRKPAWPNYRFVEKLRDLSNPGSIPSTAVQKRRLEMFVGMALRFMAGTTTPVITFGVGYGADYGFDFSKSMQELGFDEMEWAELLLMLNDQLPGKNLGLGIQDYQKSRFPRLTDLVDHLLTKLEWNETRRIDVTWH